MSHPPTIPLRSGPPTPQQTPPARVVPVSGVATAAFWFALIGPATFGIGSGLAIILAIAARAQTRTGAKGGHFLAVTALFFGIAGLVAWIAAVFLLRDVLQRMGAGFTMPQ